MSKRTSAYGCENCDSFLSRLKKKEYEYEQKLRSLTEVCEKFKKDSGYWQKRAQLAEGQIKDNFEQSLQLDNVTSDICTPDKLQISKMRTYYNELLRKHPNLRNILQPLFSGHFLSKEKSHAKDSRWYACAGLYRAFVADVVLRSKNSKAVGRTNMLLGLMIYQSKCPDTVCRLLQRVKIIPTRDTIEKYLTSLPKADLSLVETVISHFDNCDIYRHVAKRYTMNSSDFIHMCTRITFSIPRPIGVPQSQIWKTYNVQLGVKFARNLLLDYGLQCTIAEKASTIITKAIDIGGLKFALRDTCEEKPKSKLTVLPVEMDRQTISHADVSAIVRNLAKDISGPTLREICIMGGDWQTFSRMFELMLKEPNDWKFLVPIPGEWHWNWHILKAIFKIWATYLLNPIAIEILCFKNFDIKGKNFHHAEHLLELITVGLEAVIAKLREKHPGMTDMNIQTHYGSFSHLYELLYFWNWYICPYWHTRSALKAGDSKTINLMWRYWLPLFITARKHNYAIMSIRFLWMLQFLHPNIVSVINDFRTFSFTGAKMTQIALDGLNELVRTANAL
jgi:hypothetical protein